MRGAAAVALAMTMCCWAAGAFASPWEPGEGRRDAVCVRVYQDLMPLFDPALVSNALSASAASAQRAGKVALPGIFLHPMDQGDAVLSFPGVTIPDEPGRRCFLLFHIGIRDGVPWGADNAEPDGVRFKVAVNGDLVYSENCVGEGWRARAVDLTPWAGTEVRLELRTDSIGNSSYDWSVFGDPALVGVPEAAKAPNPQSSGLWLARVECAGTATVCLSAGESTTRASLPKGVHWVPVHFSHFAPLEQRIESGAAEISEQLVAVHAAKLTPPELDVASPLVTADTPFNVLLTTRNAGRGSYTQGEEVALGARKGSRVRPWEEPEGAAQRLSVLPPGDSTTVQWTGLRLANPGDYVIAAGPAEAAVHVFPETPPLGHERSGVPGLVVKRRGAVAAELFNPRSRLTFVRDRSRRAYAVADVWNGTAWQRVASLYPLVSLVLAGADGMRESYAFKAVSFEDQDGRVVISGEMERDGREPWPVQLVFGADPVASRIEIAAQLTAPAQGDLLAFRGPAVLAGDRAFGADKDFAVFPGLEYLHADEPSSSERDLAYPLSDRRVPAKHKIATPLMAVQAEGALVALLWDANQHWAPGERHPAARFDAPAMDSGRKQVHMGLFAPSVGRYVRENTFAAQKPYLMPRGKAVRLAMHLVLDHESRYAADSIVHGPHSGGLVLQAIQHWFDVYGFPEPFAQPRTWDNERALCRAGYFGPVWSDDPPGWRHCAGWDPHLLVGHAVPLLMDQRAGLAPSVAAEIDRRVGLVLDRALQEHGPHYLWTNAGCHIMMGELPFYQGFMGESLADFRRNAYARLDGREDGLWVWRPQADKYACLGTAGDHTLGQASHAAMTCLRAARLTGDPELARQALEALKQMERYEVPRGAQVWECPLYQPDILAAGQAIRAYCEAYRLTDDPAHLDQARYWAWSGLPFIYFWDMDGYPTMRYNVISVIGSTFYTHSWLGLPVVWCGLVYGYALQDLAEFDDSFPWRQVAQGIVNSAMWQQYTDGLSKGCYPDSWNMVDNRPNPADINPENILVNEFRLRGQSPEIRFKRLPGSPPVVLNSAADILGAEGSVAEGSVRFTLRGVPGFAAYSLLAPAPEPLSVEGAGAQAADSVALRSVPEGWLYDPALRAVITKHTGRDDAMTCSVSW